jgi:hypothetical protein
MRLEHGGAEHGPAGEHGQDRNPDGHGPRLPPVIAMRRVERLGETRPAERPGPVDHPRPVGRRGRAHVVDQVADCLIIANAAAKFTGHFDRRDDRLNARQIDRLAFPRTI